MMYKLLCLFIILQVITRINCECTQAEFEQADNAFLIITVFSDSRSYFPTDDEGFDKQCK